MQRLATPMVAAAVALSELDTDQASDAQLRGLLRAMRPVQDRLTALRARVAGELEHRAISAAEPGKKQRAAQDSRRDLRDQLNLTPSEAKQTAEVGRRLRDANAAAEAFARGELNQQQAAVICETLRHIPQARKDHVEQELLALAAELEIPALRRAATRILGREDGHALEDRERRQHARRAGRISDRDDGGLQVNLTLYGTGKELALTAFHAFATHDGANERRSPEQRAADAFEQIFTVALNAGEAPTHHGVRPHVQIQITSDELEREAGIAELGYSGPVPIRLIRPLIGDCSITWVILDNAKLPKAIAEARRTVPAAIREALRARDKGCTWRGCDAPVAWCQVAHGNLPFRLGAGWNLNDCALLCGRHHAMFDRGGWRMQIDGADVTYLRDPTMPSVTKRTLADINAPP